MKHLIIIFSLFFTLFYAYSNSLDDKGLICNQSGKPLKSSIIFRFSSGNFVTGAQFYIIDMNVELIEGGATLYSADKDFINIYEFSLNRKTLDLSNIDDGNIVGQCKVFNNRQEHEMAIKKIIGKIQKDVNKDLKGNKI